MHGFEERPVALGDAEAARLETRGYLLKRVTSLDLGVAPSAHEARRGRARRGTLGSQVLEAGAVHRFERQLVLKALGRPRLEIAGRLERAIALETCPVALEAQRPSFCGPSATLPSAA